MATLEEIKADIRTELQTLRDGDGIYKLVDNVKVEITDEDFEQMIEDRAENSFDQQNNGYKYARRDAYPSIQEFMEAYTEKEIGEDSTKWDAYVVKYNQVRTDNPKPGE